MTEHKKSCDDWHLRQTWAIGSSVTHPLSAAFWNRLIPTLQLEEPAEAGSLEERRDLLLAQWVVGETNDSQTIRQLTELINQVEEELASETTQKRARMEMLRDQLQLIGFMAQVGVMDLPADADVQGPGCHTLRVLGRDGKSRSSNIERDVASRLFERLETLVQPDYAPTATFWQNIAHALHPGSEEPLEITAAEHAVADWVTGAISVEQCVDIVSKSREACEAKLPQLAREVGGNQPLVLVKLCNFIQSAVRLEHNLPRYIPDKEFVLDWGTGPLVPRIVHDDTGRGRT